MPIIVYSGDTYEPWKPPAAEQTEVTISLSQGGNRLELTGPWLVLAGVQGLDDPPMSLTTSSSSAVYGEHATGMVVPAREVFLPVLLRAASGPDWQVLRDSLRSVTRLDVPTRITVSTRDGRSRHIDGYYSPDVIGWTVDTWSASGWQALGLTFRCPRPWWVGDRPLTLGPWRAATNRGFLGKLLPVKLGVSQIFGVGVAVYSDGDVATLPTWTIDGTATSIAVVHEESGRSWSLSTAGMARPITVVTDPQRSAVYDGNGVRRWSSLAAPYDLWPLPVGWSTVRVDIVGADATTVVTGTADTHHMAAL